MKEISQMHCYIKCSRICMHKDSCMSCRNIKKHCKETEKYPPMSAVTLSNLRSFKNKNRKSCWPSTSGQCFGFESFKKRSSAAQNSTKMDILGAHECLYPFLPSKLVQKVKEKSIPGLEALDAVMALKVKKIHFYWTESPQN